MIIIRKMPQAPKISLEKKQFHAFNVMYDKFVLLEGLGCKTIRVFIFGNSMKFLYKSACYINSPA